MNKSHLRLISYFSLVFLMIILKFFTNLGDNVILSIALIMVFLILFTFVFDDNGSKPLRIIIIIFSFIGLPLLVLFLLGVLDYFSNPMGGIALVLIIIALGIISLITIRKLDYAELKWE